MTDEEVEPHVREALDKVFCDTFIAWHVNGKGYKFEVDIDEKSLVDHAKGLGEAQIHNTLKIETVGGKILWERPEC